MAVLAAIIVAAALLEDDNLLALRLRNDFRGDRKARGILKIAALAGQQDVVQRDLVTGFASDLLDHDLVSCGNAILLAARAHDCEHGFSLLIQTAWRETRSISPGRP